MKISVITSAFNAQKTISDTIESVAAQSYRDYEHIIVDGGSSDATMDIVRRHAHPRLRWVSEKDKGVYDGMNRGARLAQGDLIGFLNADDFYCRQDALAAIATAAPGYDAVCAAVAIVREDEPGRLVRSYGAGSFRPWMLRFGHMPPHPGFYVRREAWIDVGPFDDSLRIAGDFDWMVRFFLRKRLRAKALASTLVAMRQGGVSMRGLSSKVTANRELRRALRSGRVGSHPALLWSRYALKWLQFVQVSPDFPAPENVRWPPVADLEEPPVRRRA